MIEKKYKINKQFDTVRTSFSDLSGDLLQKTLPIGCGLDNYKGLRRRAVLRVWMGSKLYKFKVAMYSSSKNKYYFHIINTGECPLNIKFFSNRVTVTNMGKYSEISESVEFTTKNKWLDRILSLFINVYYFNKGIKYKLFFRNK
jgi:hypothetical protein